MRTINRFLAAPVALTLLLAGCGGGTGASTTSTTVSPETTSTTTATVATTEPSTTSTAAPTTTLSPSETGVGVYFMLEELEPDAGGPFLVPVYRASDTSGDVARLALDLLVEGPDEGEAAGTPSISTAIPEGTRVLGVEIDGGLAKVDLSGEFDDGGGSMSMFARLAQVVYTVTRLDGVDEVEFLIEGEPVTVFSSEGIELGAPVEREDYYDFLAPIFVDSPAWGEPVTSPLDVSGVSNVFEAVSQIMLTDDDGASLFEDTVMASCGTGCWGDWSIEIPYSVDRDQFGSLIVWAFSPADGSRINVREYPVRLR